MKRKEKESDGTMIERHIILLTLQGLALICSVIILTKALRIYKQTKDR